MHEVCTYLVLESSMYVLTFTCGLCRSIFHGFFLGPPVCFLQFCMVLPSFLHSLPQTTIFCTNESTKKHDLDHDFRTKESTARRRATQTTFFARRRIQKSMISSTVFGTRESTEKHNCFTKESTKQHDSCTMQEERTKKIQKAQFVAWRRTPKSTISSTILAWGRAPKSTFVSKGKHQKARFLHDARRSAPKRSKKHNLLHEGGHQKARSRARFLARGRAPKSKENNTKKHDLEHDFWHEGKHQK